MTSLSEGVAVSMTRKVRSTHFVTNDSRMTRTPCWTWVKGPTGRPCQTSPPNTDLRTLRVIAHTHAPQS